MASEVRVQAEGLLRWVQASGSGNVWATASAPQSGLVGYVQSFSHTSAQEMTTIMERGKPTHHKFMSSTPPEVTYEFLWTGTNAFPTATASGASVPMFHLEFRASASETPGTGVYYQYHGCVPLTNDFTENAEGNTISYSFRALGMNGPSASGYLG